MSTSSGAKTLFLPTPFAVRTALLDVAIRTKGLVAGRSAFEWIKQLGIAVRPPDRIVVTNLFAKIVKPTRKVESEHAMDRTIAFREYAQLDGTVALALNVTSGQSNDLTSLLLQLNYFGKRGSFFQIMNVPQRVGELPKEFIVMDGLHNEINEKESKNSGSGLIQIVDDWGESLTFDKVDIYTDEKIILGKDRVRRTVILPYKMVRSSKSFSYYETLVVA